MSLEVKRSWNTNMSVTSLWDCNKYISMWRGNWSSKAQFSSLRIAQLPWDHFLTLVLHLFWRSQEALCPRKHDGWTRLQIWHECYITPGQEKIPEFWLHCKLEWENGTAVGGKWTPTETRLPLQGTVHYPGIQPSLDLCVCTGDICKCTGVQLRDVYTTPRKRTFHVTLDFPQLSCLL